MAAPESRLGSWFAICWLHQLDPVAERVVYITPIITLKRLILDDWITLFGKPSEQSGEIGDNKSRMSLLRWPEVLLYSQMNFQRAALEPAAAPNREMGRFSYFGNP